MQEKIAFQVAIFVGGLIIGSFLGFMLSLSVTEKEGITPIQMARNAEHVLLFQDYPYRGLVEEKKIGELRSTYIAYSYYGDNNVARLAMASFMERLCTTEVGSRWYDELNESEKRMMEEMLGETAQI